MKQNTKHKFNIGDLVTSKTYPFICERIRSIIYDEDSNFGYKLENHDYNLFYENDLILYDELPYEIYFHPFVNENANIVDFMHTDRYIKEHVSVINTYSMINFSFDLISQGYKIFLVSKSGKILEIKPHMTEIEKDLRIGHNLRKLFLGGTFNFHIYN